MCAVVGNGPSPIEIDAVRDKGKGKFGALELVLGCFTMRSAEWVHSSSLNTLVDPTRLWAMTNLLGLFRNLLMQFSHEVRPLDFSSE